jgi:hypothetical protein
MRHVVGLEKSSLPETYQNAREEEFPNRAETELVSVRD